MAIILQFAVITANFFRNHAVSVDKTPGTSIEIRRQYPGPQFDLGSSDGLFVCVSQQGATVAALTVRIAIYMPTFFGTFD